MIQGPNVSVSYGMHSGLTPETRFLEETPILPCNKLPDFQET